MLIIYNSKVKENIIDCISVVNALLHEKFLVFEKHIDDYMESRLPNSIIDRMRQINNDR